MACGQRQSCIIKQALIWIVICLYNATNSKMWFYFQPEKAIEVYGHALEKTPEDGALVSKFGKFLIKTHYFDKVCTCNPFFGVGYVYL